MVLPAIVPSKLIEEPCTVPKLILWPVSVPLMVPLLMHALVTVIVPAMGVPCWRNTTMKVPVVEGYFLLAKVPFQVPATWLAELAEADVLATGALVVTAETRAGLCVGEGLLLLVGPFPFPDELHPALTSRATVTTVMTDLRCIACPRSVGVLAPGRRRSRQGVRVRVSQTGAVFGCVLNLERRGQARGTRW